MLSKNIRDMFADFENRNPGAKKQRALEGLFIDIAVAIQRIRTRAGISQRELAVRMNTSHPTIVRWEAPGCTGYTLSKLAELADALDYDLDVHFRPKVRIDTKTEVAQWRGNKANEARFEGQAQVAHMFSPDYNQTVAA